MPNSSFTQKIIKVSFVLAKGEFGAEMDLGNTTIKQGLRIECEVEKGGHPSKNSCKLKIYGMVQDDMTKLTMVVTDRPLAVRRNFVKIEAGDASGLATVFTGEITSAYASYQQPPNLHFQLEAIEGYYPAVKPTSPKSYNGTADVSALMSDLASQMGYEFEDNGVNVKLSNPYLHGTAFQQASKIADSANIEFGVDNNVLFIAPRGSARKKTLEVPLISAETGMKGYPIFDKKGLRIETLYNPNVQLGGLIKVITSIMSAQKNPWRVHGLHHHLSCELPNGPWFTKIEASYVGS